MTKVEIKSGKVYVNGKITTDPTLIGLAILDIADEQKDLHISASKKDVLETSLK